MPRYVPSPSPRHHEYDSDSDSEAPSPAFESGSELSSPSGSFTSLSSTSICAVAGSPCSTQSILEESTTRVFGVASEDHIDDIAYELTDLIEGSTQESASILHAIQLLIEVGARNMEYARSIALIAEELHMQLVAFDEAVAEVFKCHLGSMGVERFMEAWRVLETPDSAAGRTGGSSPHRDDRLLGASVLIGDLYSSGFVAQEMLENCIRTAVQTLAGVECSACVLAIVARANSYVGEKLSFSFLAELAFNLEVYRNQGLPQPERVSSTMELRFLDELVEDLIGDSLSIQNISTRYCALPYNHVVDARLHRLRSKIDASGHLEKMYELHHTLATVSSCAPGSCNSDQSPFASVVSMTLTMKLDLEGTACDHPSEEDQDSDSDFLEELRIECGSSDSLAPLDIDFNESSPAFARQGLMLSLNGHVPRSLTTPLPMRR